MSAASIKGEIVQKEVDLMVARRAVRKTRVSLSKARSRNQLLDKFQQAHQEALDKRDALTSELEQLKASAAANAAPTESVPLNVKVEADIEGSSSSSDSSSECERERKRCKRYYEKKNALQLKVAEYLQQQKKKYVEMIQDLEDALAAAQAENTLQADELKELRPLADGLATENSRLYRELMSSDTESDD
jgi:hypothetical protein